MLQVTLKPPPQGMRLRSGPQQPPALSTHLGGGTWHVVAVGVQGAGVWVGNGERGGRDIQGGHPTIVGFLLVILILYRYMYNRYKWPEIQRVNGVKFHPTYRGEKHRTCYLYLVFGATGCRHQRSYSEIVI